MLVVQMENLSTFRYLTGTASGRVIKAINSDSGQQVKTVIIEELQVFSHKTVIKDLKVLFVNI